MSDFEFFLLVVGVGMLFAYFWGALIDWREK